ncbi:oxidoreductase, 2-nitropropane dioxygenase family, putative [Aspergillus udagawae]|uniref:Oxidoreductase, 2-nitropropane dioxygenase family, putative n=1 Tax=Aspergillus udagawae TaxID=91492 RepID=A0ABQ1B459_9EURO|nr:oxidoreductase, 2-nitropropane dioxygenase family, putative [Aspergillus udagawae]
MYSPDNLPHCISDDYPWTASPLIVSAPMAKVAMPKLAVAVSKAGGLGFIAAGYHSDHLEDLLEEAEDLLQEGEADAPAGSETGSSKFLPVGVGFITWSASLEAALPSFSRYCPAAVWLFAPPTGFQDLIPWATKIREATAYRTNIWVQIGSVKDATEVVEAIDPDVMVVQGLDAGGHSLAKGASIISLVPEIDDKLRDLRPYPRRRAHVLAAGGISDHRGVAASIALGAQGCVLGTRFLASPESMVAHGYQKAILDSSDGGISTVRTKIYDKVRDIHGWPEGYNGRGLINKTFIDHLRGLSEVKNRELYREELNRGDGGYGSNGRLTTYAGTGVGLIKEVIPAGDIVKSLREGARKILYGQNQSKL